MIACWMLTCNTIADTGLSWGIYFTAYNNAKLRWQRMRGEELLPAPLHLLSAAEAGVEVGTYAGAAPAEGPS